MKYLVFSMTLLAILFLFTMGWTMETNLMPLPAKMSFAEGKFRLEENFTISVTGKGDDRLYTASTRALRRLSGRTGLFFPQDFITAQMPIEDAAMSIECQRPGRIVLHEDESYSLAVSPEKIRLAAETDIGVLRGLETFLQLLSVDDSGYFFPAVRIDDTPRYEWRGLLIDACRHFMPVDVIKRNLDGMAAVKLNVLHWHLTEDQGFRIESKCFPKLHLLGSDGFYYSQAQIRDIVDYASDRGIRIVPEFDMPGHATSWIVAYPELGSAPAPSSIERKWGIKDPTMDPTRESTYLFLEEFIEEMCGLFPDEYFHIGGDENNGRQWDANEDIQVFMKEKNIEDNHPDKKQQKDGRLG
jgi:hexosaminidase